MPSGSVLSRKCGVEAVVRAAEGVGHELRAERRAADADHEHVAEALGGGRTDPAVVDPCREVGHALLRVADLGRERRRRRELRRAQPVVADHALLVGVRDRALLERRHRLERPAQGGREAVEGGRREPACGSRSSRKPRAASSNSSVW